MTDHRKRSLYLPEKLVEELVTEAKRQDRSLSWVMQQAWRLARAEIMCMPAPGADEYLDRTREVDGLLAGRR